ncbi:unnamed protein product [Closterium sp. NIES-64]|nr:unnamed protein product [Closterium sp. NIES-64]
MVPRRHRGFRERGVSGVWITVPRRLVAAAVTATASWTWSAHVQLLLRESSGAAEQEGRILSAFRRSGIVMRGGDAGVGDSWVGSLAEEDSGNGVRAKAARSAEGEATAAACGFVAAGGRLPAPGDAALARARGARARVELARVVEVAVEAAEGVGVAVGVVAGVEVVVAAAEAEAAEAASVGAEAAVVAEVEAAVAEEVELGEVGRLRAAPHSS